MIDSLGNEGTSGQQDNKSEGLCPLNKEIYDNASAWTCLGGEVPKCRDLCKEHLESLCRQGVFLNVPALIMAQLFHLSNNYTFWETADSGGSIYERIQQHDERVTALIRMVGLNEEESFRQLCHSKPRPLTTADLLATQFFQAL